jgi:hypothetical protein
MITSRLRSLPPVYPLALALAGVLTLFMNAGEPATVLPRPLLVVAGLVIGLQLLLSAVLLSRELGSLALTIAVFLLAGLWPVAVALAVAPAWWLIVAVDRRSRGEAPPSREPLRAAHGLLNVFGVVLLGLVLVSATVGGAFRFYGPPGDAGGADASSAPNLYLVLLDGYPSPATLEQLGVDIGPFVDGLESLDFELPASARSNYTQTWPTLASMFRMGYLHDVPGLLPVPAELGEQRRRLTALINAGRALGELRSAGYRIVTHTSPFSSVSLLAADEVHEPPLLNEFEELVLRKSGVLGLLGDAGESWVANQSRAWIEASIDSVAVHEDDGPAFVFHHVMAPHPPFLFEMDGSPTPLRECYPKDCPFWVTELAGTETSPSEYRDALRAELAYLNARLLDSLRVLVASDPDAAVLLFADHGLRYDESDADEPFSVFFAARTPGRTGTFGSDVFLVNALPTLLNAYAGTELPSLDYSGWRSGLLPLDLTPVKAP